MSEINPFVTLYMATIGKRGGLATSEAKQAAARENGKSGGRPKTKQKKSLAKPKRL